MPLTQKRRLLALGTALGDDKLVVERFSMSEQLARPIQIDLELASDDRAIKFDDIVGTNTTVRLELPDGKTRYFNGFVSRFVQAEHQLHLARYRATLVPWLWFLTRTSDCCIFQNKKVPEIIEDVFKGHGFKDCELKLTGTHDAWEYCGYVAETIKDVCARLEIDQGRIYMVGFSNGGMLAYRFAAERGDLLAAVAPLAASIGGKPSEEAPQWHIPVPKHPVSVISFHGLEDDDVPYEGGLSRHRGGTRL